MPIWLDEPSTTLEAWKTDFLAPEAREVVRAVGAWIVVFRAGSETLTPFPLTQDDKGDVSAETGDIGSIGGREGPWTKTQAADAMRAIRSIIEHAYAEDGGYEAWDGTFLVVGMPRGGYAGSAEVRSTRDILEEEEKREEGDEEWEDLCWDLGFEFVDCSGIDVRRRGQSEDGVGSGVEEKDGGVREKKGVERVREALEANDWSGGGGDEEGDALDEFDEFESAGKGHFGGAGYEEDVGFSMERSQMEREFMGLKLAMGGRSTVDGEEDEEEADDEAEQAMQVEELETMMRNMIAAKGECPHPDKHELKGICH